VVDKVDEMKAEFSSLYHDLMSKNFALHEMTEKLLVGLRGVASKLVRTQSSLSSDGEVAVDRRKLSMQILDVVNELRSLNRD
jgi:hypothetical protein